MRAVWHLAVNDLLAPGRRWSRTALLVIAVAIATILTAAVASSIGTMTRSLSELVGGVAGSADLRLRHRFNGRLDLSLVGAVRSWPGVKAASPQLMGGVTLKLQRTGKSRAFQLMGVEPDAESQTHPRKFVDGAMISQTGQVALDERVARRLEAQVGDQLDVIHFGDPITLAVTGIFDRPPLGVLQRPLAIVTLPQAQTLTGYGNSINTIDIALDREQIAVDDLDTAADDFAALHEAAIPDYAKFDTPGAAKAGLNRAIAATNLMMFVLTMLVSISAGFIILTSLTVAVSQRMRELAILRCIGAARWQMAMAQLVVGGSVALAGCVIGAPIGIWGAWWFVYLRHADGLPGGFDPNWSGVALASCGSLLAGLLGATYPAMLAAGARPLEALAIRAKSVSWRGIAIASVVGLLCIAIQPALLASPVPTEFAFWFYAYIGLGLAFVGFFLLTVPLLMALTWAAAPLLAAVLRVPGELLRQSILATPFRHGGAAGALMVSMGLLVSIWTSGRSIMTGWFADIKMPDAFVHSYTSLNEQQWRAVQNAKGVTGACPVVMFPVTTEKVQFGLKSITPPLTMFVSFDPKAFFDMTDLDWIQGDPDTALARLKQGDAVLVSREYLAAHGLGVGTKMTMRTVRGPREFEVVGVIGSPGLDIAVAFFGINQNYQDASISAVFGAREDAIKYFTVDSIMMVLISLSDDVSDAAAIQSLRDAVPGAVAGSSRVIIRKINEAATRMMGVASSIAVASLIIACFGVANLIFAEVTAKRFEYGVIRAVGGGRGLLVRLVAGQTVLIALGGCLSGSILGVYLEEIGRELRRRLAGMEYELSLPFDVMAWGAAAVAAAALIAALPALWRLVRQHPREMLAGN